MGLLHWDHQLVRTDEFIADYAMKKVTEGCETNDAILTLCPEEPQVALGTLCNGQNERYDYFMRVTPPAPIKAAMQVFDTHIKNTSLDIICGGTSRLDSVVGEKVEVAKQILRAPKNSNGQNLCPNVEKSPAAYLSSVIASANDPHVEKFFDGLHVPITDSYDRYVTI